MDYFRSAVNQMASYVPGEQPLPGTPIIKLNTNENPYPPSPQVMAALQALDGEALRRYPDPFAKAFCQAVSETLGVPPDWIIVGNGSDDLLNVLVRACAEGSDRAIAYPMPTYVLYRTLAAIQPARVAEIPYPSDWQLPIEALAQTKAAITFVASPNSPSGHHIPLNALRELARTASGLVVIDEAYVDFAESSALPLAEEFENVIVLRTLSKGYSLAGLRLGFGVAHPNLLAELFKVKDSYNIDAISIRLGSAAIRDQDYKNACANKVKASRQALTEKLRSLGFAVPESQGNFVLATPPEQNAEWLYSSLKHQGILVRYFKQPGLDNKLRITVGTEADNQVLIETLANLTDHAP